MGIPILEWHEVKDPNSEVYDDLGCWNIWEAVQYNEHHPRPCPLPDILKLGDYQSRISSPRHSIESFLPDISYTVAPKWVKMIPDYEHDQHSTFWALASLAFPHFRNENLQTPLPSPRHQVSLPPSEHLVCYDYLYYVTSHLVCTDAYPFRIPL
jgi:hypothetical protein